METKGHPAVELKKTTLTPKAIIHQKFGSKACFTVEEVKEPIHTECPGLIQQKGPCLYRCLLQLPELSVVSGTFRKKKDAEQSAAEMALEKLGIHPTASDLTPQEAWESLVARIAYLFSEKFLTSLHPLCGHLGATLWRKGDLCGSIPVSVIAVYDTKLFNLCKYINPAVESNPLLVNLYIMRAATKLSGFLSTSEQHLWLKKQSPYPQDISESLSIQAGMLECIQVAAAKIPSSTEKPIETVTIWISAKDYYLDIIAKELDLEDASYVLISRNVGKASSETRLFFAASRSFCLDQSSDLLNVKETLHFEGSLNARASYLSGQCIFGDAILASIGYTWKSKDLSYEDITVQSYYRMLISKTPSGIYKLSREAIFAAELPSSFTTKANWRGSLPRDILYMFCRQHRLLEPVFSPISCPLKGSSESSGSSLKDACSATEEIEHVRGALSTAGAKQSEVSGCTFKCDVKLFSKSEDLIIVCSPEGKFKKQNDALQNACLKILSWLNEYFKNSSAPFEILYHTADSFNIQIHSKNHCKEFAVCQSVRNTQLNMLGCMRPLCTGPAYGMRSLKIEGSDSGVCPCNGSIPCIRYSISLVVKGDNLKELIEACEEFEFEIGVGAVTTDVEGVVMQLCVGQSACFTTELPPSELILASAADSARTLSLLSSKPCFMEYAIALTKLTEPMEERMEQALFSPPLSKQRVEFAVHHIIESCAATLVDFGCGAGSLLEALLNYPTSLEKIVGVDISPKGLARAAKVLNSKLVTNSDVDDVPYAGIKSVILYEGSITSFDSRLHGFDIGTCLEVIEHMEEDQACLFGDVVLSSFRPRILIISTPNYEYNVVLQRSNPASQEQEEELDEKSSLPSCRFRNHDHKFEWTREQFSRWASDLAARHNYNVEFSGVGGTAGVEPGFASQIAVFIRKETMAEVDDELKDADLDHRFNVMWEWNRINK
ncbi:small RNA 2'-O-methyltransferase [Neltuma alba]|uniref:small RNA 2'-O-methyltransferase n=1 Tax=Neltuma alba TaxID=207710 RepID=UPI0010A396F5|nr:small RNA 2'-O-methyltransferase-like [Prosopis alba]